LWTETPQRRQIMFVFPPTHRVADTMDTFPPRIADLQTMIRHTGQQTNGRIETLMRLLISDSVEID